MNEEQTTVSFMVLKKIGFPLSDCGNDKQGRIAMRPYEDNESNEIAIRLSARQGARLERPRASAGMTSAQAR